MILCIGDLHISDQRVHAVKHAIESILVTAKLQLDGEELQKYTKCIILGDITNKTPSITERKLFAELLVSLKKISDSIIVIKGTDGHDYTSSQYNFSDIELIDTSITFTEEYTFKNMVFGHYEVAGCVYSNGQKGTSTKVPDRTKEYYLGHIHKPSDLYNGSVHYVGSIYHVNFGECGETKRYCVIDENSGKPIEFIPITTLPMVQLNFTGMRGELLVPSLTVPKECDLKITAEIDTETKLKLVEYIVRLKKEHTIRHYADDIKLVDICTEVVSIEDESDALLAYCKDKRYNYETVKKELYG